MSIGTIITILSIVNGLMTAAKDAPAVIDEAKSLLAKIEPHVSAAGDDIKGAFAEAKAKVTAS